jgi:hypothetical protein
MTQYQFDLSATQAVCGPLPTNFGEGIEQTVEWFNSLSQPKA